MALYYHLNYVRQETFVGYIINLALCFAPRVASAESEDTQSVSCLRMTSALTKSLRRAC